MAKITKLARIVNELSLRLNEVYALLPALRIAVYEAQNPKRRKIRRIKPKGVL